MPLLVADGGITKGESEHSCLDPFITNFIGSALYGFYVITD